MVKSIDPVLGVQSRLTDRDWTLLTWLQDHWVLTTPQITHALFPSQRIAQLRLKVLSELQLVDKFRYLRPGGGSFPSFHVIAHRGARLIALHRGQDPPRPAETAARRQRIAASRHLEHTLGINQFFIDLAGRARLDPSMQLMRWPSVWSLDAGALIPNPDGYGEWHQDGATLPFFFEYDRGTEGHAVLAEKLGNYRASFELGMQPFPVLFWFGSSRREQHFTDHVAGSALPMLVATTAADRVADGQSPADRIWAITGHPGLHRLIDLKPMFEQVRDSKVFDLRGQRRSAATDTITGR